MLCEKCGKEFLEDWRKDKWTKNNTSCRFCSRGCANNKEHTKEINKKISEGVKKNYSSLTKEEKEKRNALSKSKLTNEDRKKGRDKQKESADKRIELLLSKGKYEEIPYKKLRQILLKETNNTCQKCGNNNWLGESIWLEVHHIDDNNSNNKKENLIVVCLNCHALLDKKYRFSGREHRSVETNW